jgi:hypothetical protein
VDEHVPLGNEGQNLVQLLVGIGDAHKPDFAVVNGSV